MMPARQRFFNRREMKILIAYALGFGAAGGFWAGYVVGVAWFNVHQFGPFK